MVVKKLFNFLEISDVISNLNLMSNLSPGVYDKLIDIALDGQLQNGNADYRLQIQDLNPEDSHTILSRHLSSVISMFLKETGSRETRLSQQVAICNSIIEFLAEKCDIVDIHEDLVSDPARRLLSIEPKVGPDYQQIVRPDTPLTSAALLTNSASDPSLLSQIKKEAASADKINILCSFIKWSGIRLLKDTLESFTARPEAKLRVLTTCYCGATDAKAVEWLASLPNTEVRISYETDQTRLHAKAYQFCRNNGFGSAYIGSANLSNAALTEGLEWTVKVSQVEQNYLWAKIAGTFDSHWNSRDFEHFTVQSKERFKAALIRERLGRESTDPQPLALFDLSPYPFQQEILDRLKAERELNDRRWQLVVAATGTGKTMVAAFDFRNWKSEWNHEAQGRQPRFLFIAHRKEILKQARQKFQGVLRDHNFGELLVDGYEPQAWNAVFASIQTWDARKTHRDLPKNYFDYIIVDEFHHAAAATYQGLLKSMRPQVLLGLTATPERHDSLDVFRFFDGHITAQIRLPDAINRQLLAPFHYFCVTDSIDLNEVTWERGRYKVREIEALYVGSDIRTRLIVDKINEYVTDISSTRGLGFCVSQEHAAYMAKQFNQVGLPSLNLDANTVQADRDAACQRLATGQLRFLFTVDLFNEGVDIPEINLVLFLRPTESLTIFLQQLGRGLRRSPGKECLTVLDFVGRANTRYGFAEKFAAILKLRRYPLVKEIEEGFPHLPACCSIYMEKIAREHILENVRRAISDTKHRWVGLVQDFEEQSGQKLTLQNFLEFHGLPAQEMYRKISWSRLLIQAGKCPDNPIENEEVFRKGCEKLVYVSDPIRLHALEALISDTPIALLDSIVVRMIASLFGKHWADISDLSEFQEWLVRNPTIKREIRELLPILENNADITMRVSPFTEIPQLALHARYTRDEVLFASGFWTADNKPRMTEGVMHVKNRNCDIFFVTLVKNENEYSPTTLYADYAVSPSLFHWQTQSRTSADSATAQRYFNHLKRKHSILLFVREQRQTSTGVTAPYYFLGLARYKSHEGSRPISIIWELEEPLPTHLYRDTAIEVG